MENDKPKKFDKSNDGVIIIETSQVTRALQGSTMKLLKLKFFLTSQTIFSLGWNIYTFVVIFSYFFQKILYFMV